MSGNDASVGGGIAADGADPSNTHFKPAFDTLNSTIAGNDATVSGGGISVIQNATATLGNTTVAYNAADTDDQGGGVGGGVYQSSDADFTLEDSLVAANTANDSGGASRRSAKGSSSRRLS